MDTKSVVLFVVLIASFAAISSEGTRKLADNYVGSRAIHHFYEMDANTVEKVWNYLRKEKDITEASNLQSIQSISASSNKRTTQKAVTVMQWEGMETFPQIMYPMVVIPRRFLKRRNVHASSPGPASSPPSVESPGIQVLALSPYLSPISSPLWPPSASPYVSPGPSPSPLTSPSPAQGIQSPTEAPEMDSWPSPDSNHHVPSAESVPSSSPPPPRPRPPPTRHEPVSENRFATASVVASAVVGVILIALLLILCTKKRSIEQTDEQRDENALLKFNSGDFSGEKAPDMSKEFKATSTAGTSLVSKKHSYVANSESTGVNQVGERAAPMIPLLGAKAPPLPPPGAPPPPPKPPAPAPPPPPKGHRPPNPMNPVKPAPPLPHHRQPSTGETSEAVEPAVPKAKLKPFFWDKVLANPGHSMVWHEIKAGSFQFNEEMMESLFGYAPADKLNNDHKKDSSSTDSPALLRIIDPRKSQNLAILLKALNVTTDEVCDALREGHHLPGELIQTLLKMAPTADEELKLRLYDGEISLLGSAERFLRVMINIPFAFKRLEALLFVSTFQEEFPSIKEAFSTLEVACNELKNSRLFLKLLEAVLKTGNRMNDGTYRGGASAFKLDTLLKLSDVKGTDGKTTLLHFVVNETIRSQGIRAGRRLKESQSASSFIMAEHGGEESSSSPCHEESDEYHRELGLQVVSGLSNELRSVKKAAIIDNENLSETISRLRHSLNKTKEFIKNELNTVEGDSDFRDGLESFISDCESDMEWLIEEEKRVMALVKSTGDYFHGKGGREEGLHLFAIVRDFLLMVDKACHDVKKLHPATQRREASTSAATPSKSKSPLDFNRRLFPAMQPHDSNEIRFSSDDDDHD